MVFLRTILIYCCLAEIESDMLKKPGGKNGTYVK
jgi:hypothetical protein